jgi:hypothetical protein
VCVLLLRLQEEYAALDLYAMEKLNVRQSPNNSASDTSNDRMDYLLILHI